MNSFGSNRIVKICYSKAINTKIISPILRLINVGDEELCDSELRNMSLRELGKIQNFVVL